MALPILYSFRRCPYAIRVRMALWISAQRCELREVVLRNKPVELLGVSPKGTVPILVDGHGQVFDQSLDIMVWALQRSDPASWLRPDAESLADSLGLIGHCDGEFKLDLDCYKYPERHPDTVALESRDRGAGFLQRLHSLLRERRWLGGKQAAISDYAILPFVRQFSMVEPDWFSAQPWPELKEWLKCLLASRVFVEVMHKVEPWVPERAGVEFPFVQKQGASPG